MNRNTRIALLVSAFSFAPHSASAQTFKDIMNIFIFILGGAMGLVFAIAFASFFYGVLIFILNTEDVKKREDAKWWMFWGVVALFVMLTIWGLVSLLVNTFHISSLRIPQL